MPAPYMTSARTATTLTSPAIQGFLAGLNAVGESYGVAETLLTRSDEHRAYPLMNAITRNAFIPTLARFKPAIAAEFGRNYEIGKLELSFADAYDQVILKTMALTTIFAPYRVLPPSGVLANLQAISQYGTTSAALVARFARDYPKPPEGIYYALGECAGRAVGLTHNRVTIGTALRSIVAGE